MSSMKKKGGGALPRHQSQNPAKKGRRATRTRRKKRKEGEIRADCARKTSRNSKVLVGRKKARPQAKGGKTIKKKRRSPGPEAADR